MKKLTVSEAIKAVETIKAYCKQVDSLACAWNECKFAKYCDAIRNRLPEEWILPNDAKKERTENAET